MKQEPLNDFFLSKKSGRLSKALAFLCIKETFSSFLRIIKVRIAV